MRIWDINPGYLNDKSLLGEHVELHGIVSIITNKKKGYFKHPETKRWVNYIGALHRRHKLIVCEMKLRSFNHNSPIKININTNIWPIKFIDTPFKQFDILSEKYKNKSKGRIPLPISAQHIWSQHKYSVMARDIKKYKEIGQYVSKVNPNQCFSDLSNDLVELLRIKPSLGGIKNSLQHMWGYFKKDNTNINVRGLDLRKLLSIIQELSYEKKEKYILESTALSELEAWI
tara:strand:- start:1992 stop:2681 length:690 start_codon:yes stop_codon:yes gene_type:complete